MLHKYPGVERLLGRQAGVVSTRQLVTLGLTNGRIERLTARWSRPTRGIHVAEVPTWESALWAGILKGPEGSVVSGLAAAHLHGITSTHPREVLVVAPVRRESFTLDHWVVQFRRGLRRGMGEPRRAWLEEALLDMAGEVSEIDVVGALTRGLAQGLTSPERFLAALQERPKLRHVAVLRDLCTYGRDVESVLEWLFDRNVIRRHGLPVPTNQVRRVAGTDTSASGAVHVLQSHFSLGQRVQSDSGT